MALKQDIAWVEDESFTPPHRRLWVGNHNAHVKLPRKKGVAIWDEVNW
ncbi:hypothetical protein [Candidatus Sodalis pierantonius]|nr:hypothetical protein [Candidatus Sodalis pierantonius]